LKKSSFRESAAKQAVRNHWNSPVLRYIYEKYHLRYRYMGFPGSNLADIRLWADMIEDVIAFELPCPHGSDKRVWVKEIRLELRRLGIPGVVYFGPFEEVVILREDYEGQHYTQEKIITLYNLDFCDEIASKIETRKYGERLWRFEAIRRILHDQQECYKRSGSQSLFIILLTIRNQIGASNIANFLSANLLSETESYCLNCNGENPIPSDDAPLIGTHAWALKAFLYNTLKTYFTQPNICALFFPLVKYEGTPIVRKKKGVYVRSPMLHWMFLCKFGESESPTPTFHPLGFLEQTVSLVADSAGITLHAEVGEVLNPDQPICPVEWFQPFEGFFFE
jgi:hypothetical protein